MAEEEYDDFGFPTAGRSRRQARRIRVRAFTSKNHWEAAFPTRAAAVAAAGGGSGSDKLATLVLAHGASPAYRADLYWAWATAARADGAARGAAADATITAAPTSAADAADAYAACLARVASMPGEVARQIELDVPRTFCEQRDFVAAARGARGAADAATGSRSATMDAARSDAVVASLTQVGGGTVYDALRRMLRAFCVYHPHDEYLQSMNFVAAFMLLVFGRHDEARAFWCFEWLCGTALYGYYTPDMAGLTGDCALFRALLAARKPALAAHMDALGGVDMSALFLPRWLLCLYLNCFPPDIVVRVWDCVMAAGAQAPRTLLEVALAVTAMCEGALLDCASFVDAAEVLKHMGTHVSDSAELLLLTRTPPCSLQGKGIADWRAAGAPLAAVASPLPPPLPLPLAAAASARSPSLRSPSLRSPSLRSPSLRSPLAAPLVAAAVAGAKRARGGGPLPRGSPTSPPPATPPAAAAAAAAAPRADDTPTTAAAVAAADACASFVTPLGGERRARLSVASPGRTPPVHFDASLDRVALPAARSPAHTASVPLHASPRGTLALRKMLSPSKLASPPLCAAPAPRPAAVGVPPLSSAPPSASLAAAIAAALNPCTAAGAASARKRRELMRAAHAAAATGVVGVSSSSVRKAGRLPPSGSATLASPPPSAAAGGAGSRRPRYATHYDDYDDDAADPATDDCRYGEQLMAFAPPSSKRPRADDAAAAAGGGAAPLAPSAIKANAAAGVVHARATLDAAARPLSLQLQLLSPPRSTTKPHALTTVPRSTPAS